MSIKIITFVLLLAFMLIPSASAQSCEIYSVDFYVSDYIYNNTDILTQRPEFALNITSDCGSADITTYIDDMNYGSGNRPTNETIGSSYNATFLNFSQHEIYIYAENGTSNMTSGIWYFTIHENITTCELLDNLIAYYDPRDLFIMNDIDCFGYTNYTSRSIENDIYGQGYTIGNLTIDCPPHFYSSCSVFGVQGVGSVYDLVLSNITINANGEDEVGIVSSASFTGVWAEYRNVNVSDSIIINAGNRSGLFGGEMHNTDIHDCVVRDSNITCIGIECGGFIGEGINVNVTNSYVENPYMNCTVGSPYCGGFAGKIERGNVSDCYSEGGHIYGNPLNNTARVAGFVQETGINGWGVPPTVFIERCWTTTDLQGSSVGGFVNTIYNTVIDECYSDQNIITTSSGQFGDAGGFADWGHDFVINNSYSTSDMSGIGQMDGFMALLGWGSNQEIYNSYAGGILTGDISGFGNSGCGFGCGSLSGYSGNYWDSDTIMYNETKKDTTYSTPKTTEEMTQQSTFSGWDFTNIWQLPITYDTYPYFQWQIENLPYARPLIYYTDPENVTYSHPNFDINVYSLNSVDTWQYDLNGNVTTFTPNTTDYATEGSNAFILSANNSHGMTTTLETMFFSYSPTPSPPITGQVPLATPTMLGMLMGAGVLLATLGAGMFAMHNMSIKTLAMIMIMMVIGLQLAVTLASG